MSDGTRIRPRQEGAMFCNRAARGLILPSCFIRVEICGGSFDAAGAGAGYFIQMCSVRVISHSRLPVSTLICFFSGGGSRTRRADGACHTLFSQGTNTGTVKNKLGCSQHLPSLPSHLPGFSGGGAGMSGTCCCRWRLPHPLLPGKQHR